MKRTLAIIAVVILLLTAVLCILAQSPFVYCSVDIPENYLQAAKSQSKGLYSRNLPLVPIRVDIDSYENGELKYTIHYFPFGSVRMGYIEGEGYCVIRPLSGL